MKPHALFVAAIAATLLAAAAQAQESLTLRKIKETGIVTLGFRDASIPFSYVDGRQRPIGYSMDICFRVVEAIKARLKLPNLEIKFTPVNSANRIAFITSDLVDLECGSTTNNAERAQKIAFTLTTFVAESSMVSKRAANIRAIEDLRGRSVVSTAGTTSLSVLGELNRNRGLGMSILTAKDHFEAFQMLDADRADAFVMDDVLLYGLVSTMRNATDYRIHNAGLSVEPYGIAMRRNDPEFKKLADDTIAALFRSGEIEQIYRKWFLSPIPPGEINMKLPMSPVLRKLIMQPTDSPDPADYR